MPSRRRHPNLPGILTARGRAVQMHQVFLTSVELWCDVDKASWGHCDHGYPIFILKKGTPGQQVQLPETLLWLTLKGCVPVFREAGAQPTRAAGQPALTSASFQPHSSYNKVPCTRSLYPSCLQVVKVSHLRYPSLQLLPCCLTVAWLAQTLSVSELSQLSLI